MRFPVQLIPTIKDGLVLEERKKVYEKSRRRFLDKRLGSRNRPGLLQSAKAFVREHYKEQVERGNVEQFEVDGIIASQDLSMEKFEKSLARAERVRKENKANMLKELEKLDGLEWKKKNNELKKVGTSQRVRDLLGPGVGLLEITFEGDWHYHRHLIYDTRYLPWPYLVVLWNEATKQEGKVVHIGKVGKTDVDMLELFKYTSKPWEVPEGKKQELRDAIKGVKRVLPLGGAKPVKVDHPCPICGDILCKAGFVGTSDEFEIVHLGGKEYRVVGVGEDGVWKRLCFEKRPSGWVEVNAESVYLILRELAWHSTPAPPVQMVLVGA
jgi:hypothetical protein